MMVIQPVRGAGFHAPCREGISPMGRRCVESARHCSRPSPVQSSPRARRATPSSPHPEGTGLRSPSPGAQAAQRSLPPASLNIRRSERGCPRPRSLPHLGPRTVVQRHCHAGPHTTACLHTQLFRCTRIRFPGSQGRGPGASSRRACWGMCGAAEIRGCFETAAGEPSGDASHAAPASCFPDKGTELA